MCLSRPGEPPPLEVDEKCAVRNGVCHASHIIRPDSSPLFIAASRPTGLALFLLPSLLLLLLLLPPSTSTFTSSTSSSSSFSSSSFLFGLSSVIAIPIPREIDRDYDNDGRDVNSENRSLAVKISRRSNVAYTGTLARLDSLQRAVCVHRVKGIVLPLC